MFVMDVGNLTHLDNLNIQLCRTLKKSPYELVFVQPPRTTPFAELPKRKGSCIMEEEVADLMNGKYNGLFHYLILHPIWMTIIAKQPPMHPQV